MRGDGGDVLLVACNHGLGDLILALPAVELLRRRCPERRIELLCTSANLDIARLSPAADEVHLSTRKFEGFGRILRKTRPVAVLFLYATLGGVLRSWLHGVPARAGNGLRWYSPFLNRRRPVHRRRPPLHETSYCLRLASLLLDEGGREEASRLEELVPGGVPRPALDIPAEAVEGARRLMPELGLDPDEPFIVVHPGSNASSLNPSPRLWGRIAAVLGRGLGMPVVLTGGPGEMETARRTAEHAEPLGVSCPTAAGRTSLPVLAALLDRAAFVCASSTGPLHLAAALGTPCAGVYPHNVSMNPLRWAPLGELAAAVTPEEHGACGGGRGCAGNACPIHPCTETVEPSALLETAIRLMKKRGERRT